MATPDPVERIPTRVFADARDASRAVAARIADLVRSKAARGERCVLGLATGSTPTGVYAELVRMHREEGLSFANVTTFNLDEYFPMEPRAQQSYVRFMAEHLFDHLDVPAEHVHIPDGSLPATEVHAHCKAYEEAIRAAGGLDLQLLGIGRSGHVGFNEPGSDRRSRTRLITLARATRADAADDFFGEERVPRRAITMGVGTILDAREIVLMAFGEHKASIVAAALEGETTDAVPATFLQDHPAVEALLDQGAASRLARFETPWRTGPVTWSDPLVRRAVIWLARERDKPVLKLTDEDYNEAGLQDLLAEHGAAYGLNLRVFRSLQATITGWPGGKPSHERLPGDPVRERDRVFPKRVLVFAPRPDDDVVGMGGTLSRLVAHGHEVRVAYQVSGSLTVADDDAIRFTEFAAEFQRAFGLEGDDAAAVEQEVAAFLTNRQPGEVDTAALRRVKALIRRSESRAAARACGLSVDQLTFLDLPFYEAVARGRSLTEADIEPLVEVLRRVQPHQVYAAGGRADPHGTHRTCLEALRAALERVEDEAWFPDCEVWLYHGPWKEWEPAQTEMAVPLSPQELERKRAAIFQHESQKRRARSPHADDRSLWLRPEDRNQATAQLYDRLGLAEYEAIEAFVRLGHGPETASPSR